MSGVAAHPGVAWKCLGVTQGGNPRHPLHVLAETPLVPFVYSGTAER